MKRSTKFSLFILAMIILVLAVNFFNISSYIEGERLRIWIESAGPLGPLIFMLIYALAPSLFFPGLPLTVAGGLLFGPVWGTLYVIVGATTGATIAFLIARKMGRDWVEEKLGKTGAASKWKELDQKVEREGWKVVAFTRLIPLFPFNFLNYAFGLTGVKTTHFIVASFIFMLPGTIAYVLFSSSLVDLIGGKISKELVAGIILIVAVSLIPIIYKKVRRKKEGED